MCVSKNLQIRGICISSALFLFYAPKFLKRPKIILSFLRYLCFNAKIPHRSAGFLPASFLSMQVGGDYWTRTSDLLRVKIRRDVKALLLDAFRHFWPRFLWVQITVLSTVSTR